MLSIKTIFLQVIQIVNKMRYLLVFSLLITTSILSQNCKAQNEIYLIFDGTNKLLSKDLSGKNFRILKYNFKTKSRQTVSLKNKKKFIEPNQFYYSFYYFKTPKRVVDITNFKITPIECISKGETIVKHQTIVYFIEKINDNLYLIFETRMEFEE